MLHKLNSQSVCDHWLSNGFHLANGLDGPDKTRHCGKLRGFLKSGLTLVVQYDAMKYSVGFNICLVLHQSENSAYDSRIKVLTVHISTQFLLQVC